MEHHRRVHSRAISSRVDTERRHRHHSTEATAHHRLSSSSKADMERRKVATAADLRTRSVPRHTINLPVLLLVPTRSSVSERCTFREARLYTDPDAQFPPVRSRRELGEWTKSWSNLHSSLLTARELPFDLRSSLLWTTTGRVASVPLSFKLHLSMPITPLLTW